MDELSKHVSIYMDIINERLQSISDLYLQPDADSIIRAENYVKVNTLFSKITEKEMHELVSDLGLLPCLFLLPGVNEIQVRILNNFDYSGFVRYIRTTIVHASNGENINKVLSELIPDGEKSLNHAVVYFLDLLVNAEETDYSILLGKYYDIIGVNYAQHTLS